MKKVTLLTVTNNPYYNKTIESIKDISDELHFKFHPDYHGDRWSMASKIRQMMPRKTFYDIDDDYDIASTPGIYEKLLREIDRSNADLVITINGGEIFQPSVGQEINDFWNSNKLAMMFNFDNFITDDNRAVFGHVIYPKAPQMKIFKWRKKLSYIPYKGDCKIYNYRKANDQWLAATKMQSYECYTKDMEKSFIKRLKDAGEI